MTQEEDFMKTLLTEMTMQLLAIGTDDFGDKDFGGMVMGNLMHLEVRNLQDEVCLQVVGTNTLELAEQLVLACFHNLSIEHLGALHMRPLQRGLQVRREKK